MKQYNGEKAIISLTSWKARINTVSKTIFSLLKQCPGFHIVLVLSEEEFPNKEKDLPENLKLFIDNNMIEILWVFKNYKSLKKVVFTLDKYRNVPIISADDDCLYKFNYAEELYQYWLLDKECFISSKDNAKYKNTCHQHGPCSLFPPYYFKEFGIKCITDKIIERNQDDDYYMVLRDKLHLNKYKLTKKNWIEYCNLHDNQNALSNTYMKSTYIKDTLKIYEEEIKAG